MICTYNDCWAFVFIANTNPNPEPFIQSSLSIDCKNKIKRQSYAKNGFDDR